MSESCVAGHISVEDLGELDYTGFSERKIQFIKETIVRFQHFEVAPNSGSGSWAWIRIDGAMFGQPQYDYWIYRVQKGIKVQVEKKFGIDRDLFGIIVCRDSVLQCGVYHTGNCRLLDGLDDNL